MASGPVLLSLEHDFKEFDCGNKALNEWLQKYALQNQKAGAARTFAVCNEMKVIGYYSLAVGSVENAASTNRARKGLAKHPIPVMVLARFAVDKAYQGKKIGQSMIRDAILKTLQASEIAGIRAIFVQAKDETAKSFYKRFGFEESPLSPMQMMLLIKDIRQYV